MPDRNTGTSRKTAVGPPFLDYKLRREYEPWERHAAILKALLSNQL